MTAVAIFRLVRTPFDRLFDALLDPVRSNRAVLVLLTGYATTWTLYGSIVHSSQDLHPDMTELIAWSRDLSLGYLKHPPLAAWLLRVWLAIVPLTDLSCYLLAMLMPTIALWVGWQFSADYLERDKRILGLALLMLVPFYNFLALKFNANTILLPTWAATTFWFLRSYRTQSILYSALAGIGAASCLLGKYWSMFLIAGLFVAALVDSRRSAYFRSAAPLITVAIGFAVLAPHMVWLYQHDFAPLEYAFARHTANSFAGVTGHALAYLAGSFAYAAAPIILVLAMARPNPKIISEMMWPSDGERRTPAVIFWAPLLLPVVGALVEHINVASLWSMPGWSLLPILLLSPPAVKIRKIDVRRILAFAVALPLVMVLTAPVIAVVIHYAGVSPSEAHARLLASETEKAWHQVTAQPLRFVGCNLANDAVAYAPELPHSLPARSFHGEIGDQVYAEIYNWPHSPDEAASVDAQLTQSGMALVCRDDEPNWVHVAAEWAARDPFSRRIEIDIARYFLGIRGRPQHYVIFIIPPQH